MNLVRGCLRNLEATNKASEDSSESSPGASASSSAPCGTSSLTSLYLEAITHAPATQRFYSKNVAGFALRWDRENEFVITTKTRESALKCFPLRAHDGCAVLAAETLRLGITMLRQTCISELLVIPDSVRLSVSHEATYSSDVLSHCY